MRPGYCALTGYSLSTGRLRYSRRVGEQEHLGTEARYPGSRGIFVVQEGGGRSRMYEPSSARTWRLGSRGATLSKLPKSHFGIACLYQM